MRKIARVFALALVAVTSVMGLINIPDELSSLGDTVLQRSVQFGGVAHSLLGLLLALGAWRRRSWCVRAAVAWTVAVTYTATVATFAWAEPGEGGVLVGTVAAGVSCALLGWWVVWAARESVTRHIPSTSDTASPTT